MPSAHTGRRGPKTIKKDTRLGAPDGASDEARTRYLHLGKVALYQMSYTRNNSDYYSKESKNVKYKMKKVFWGRNKTNRPYVLQTCC